MGNGVRKIWRWEVIAGFCLINGYRRGAEIGVSHGRFTSFLCARIPDMEMIAVDLWQEMEARDVPGAETYAGRPHEAVYENFLAHCRQFGDRVKVLRMDTAEAASRVEDGALDFVFIDADHTHEGCRRDILAWAPKVRPGGLVSGHDYNWPTVRQAVDETLGPVVLAGDNVWLKAKE